jgi:5-amino-6-(5-phospho-D-ribitylamino)uracil phosphatase
MPYRLLALDMDGTLLDPAGELTSSVQQAIDAVQQRGVRVVLCTGRRFRSARPVAQALHLEGPIVVHNGALIKDITSAATLQQCYFSDDLYQRSLAALRPVGSPIVYIDAFHENVDMLTAAPEHAHPFQQAYLQDQLEHYRVVDDMTPLPAHGVLMMSLMADAANLAALHPQVTQVLAHRARVYVLLNKNYQGHILEILSPSVSKWQALQQLAAQLGIADGDIIAVGDDDNDRAMIQHAGLGIAMGNAVPEVKAVARHVTGSNAEDGLVQALQRFVL